MVVGNRMAAIRGKMCKRLGKVRDFRQSMLAKGILSEEALPKEELVV